MVNIYGIDMVKLNIYIYIISCFKFLAHTHAHTHTHTHTHIYICFSCGKFGESCSYCDRDAMRVRE